MFAIKRVWLYFFSFSSSASCFFNLNLFSSPNIGCWPVLGRAVPDHEFTRFRIPDINRIVNSRSGRIWIPDNGYRIPISGIWLCKKSELINTLQPRYNAELGVMLLKWKASAKTGEGIYILQLMIVYRKVVLKVVLNWIVNLPDTGFQIPTRYQISGQISGRSGYPVQP